MPKSSARRPDTIRARWFRVKLDEPYHKIMGAGAAITYITDARGTRVELVQLGP